MRHFDKCKCCLEDGDLRDMWAEYVVDDGETEIYGQLLNECFAFSWQEATDYAEQICESCIKRLHDALAFRKEVISAKEILDEVIEQNIKPNVKVEVQETGDNDEETSHGDEQQEYLEMESSSLEQGEEGCKGEMYDDSSQESLYYREDHPEMILGMTPDDDDAAGAGDGDMQVEYLEDDIEAETVIATKSDQKSGTLPKKRKKSERAKNYKQYSTDDMESALEKVINNQMSRAEAAAIYNIPLKTLGAKLRLKEAGEDHGEDYASSEPESKRTEPSIDVELEKSALIENALILLENSNLTPFKSKIGTGFPCFYCRSIFDNLEKMKEHQKTSHRRSELRKLMATYRAIRLAVYVDTSDLKCRVCSENIPNLKELKSHLIKTHKKQYLKEYADIVIPFDLSESETNMFECKICGVRFETFGSIERHMNVHYRNYICKDCGTGFITKYRLQVHTRLVHIDGKYPCEFCKKVFQNGQKLKCHIDGVHNSLKRYRCSKCPERFIEYVKRQNHMETVHGLAPLMYNCNVCEKAFDLKFKLSTHMKKCHLKVRDFQCEMCPYRCFSKFELRIHMIKHTGERIYKCTKCVKSYARKRSLIDHMKSHDNDRSYVCGVCGEAFLHKRSLKGHIMQHTDNMVQEETEYLMIAD